MYPFASPMMMGQATGGGILRPQDVFATSLYTGTGATQQVSPGFTPDFAWNKNRDAAQSHALLNSLLVGKQLSSDLANAESDTTRILNATGMSTIGTSGSRNVAWFAKRAAKFFDIVTYTGDGTSGQVIPHGLGIAPGAIIEKSRSVAGDWNVYHVGATGKRLKLNTIDAAVDNGPTYFSDFSATTITVGIALNASNVTYVLLVFAHDPDTTNGIIRCGSFTCNASGQASITLGWQPQFLLLKPSSAASPWFLLDAARGWAQGGTSRFLKTNASDAEVSISTSSGPTATGFVEANDFVGANTTAIYVAIRAPIT